MPALAAAMSSGLLILSDLIVTPAEAVLLVQALPAPGAALDHGVVLGALGAVDAATIGRALVVVTLALEATRAVQLAPVTRRRWLGLRRVRDEGGTGARWHAAPGTRDRALQAQVTAAALLDRCRTTRPLLAGLVQAGVATALERADRAVPVR